MPISIKKTHVHTGAYGQSETLNWTTVKDMVSEFTSMMTTVHDCTTPVEFTHQTSRSSMTSSSSRGATFYFQIAFLVIGVVGVAANGLILYALVVSKQHKKHVMIFNQNVFDLVNCLFLVMTIPVELSNIYLSGTSGYWLCLILLSKAGSNVTYTGSQISLVAICIERYLKVVHHVWAKQKLHNWMIYSTLAFAWIIGIAIAAGEMVPTATVINGVCYSGMFLLSEMARKAYVWGFIFFDVIVISIFVFCYGRILVVIRRQAEVMAAHVGPRLNTAQDQSNKIQTSVIKTMILISVLMTVSWTPSYVYFLLAYFGQLTFDENGYYIALVTGYLYICINPFIYATKFDPVRCVLLGLMPWKKDLPATESVDNT